MKKIKAVALFSGGLDSLLSVRIMLNMNIHIYAIHFKTPFLSQKEDNVEQAKKSARTLNIDLTTYSFGKEYIEMVKQPQFGYGKNVNPCIDCRIMMLKEAKKYMEKLKADLIITGEVLGERPMTQNKKTMALIEKESGLSGKIIRPLSAKLLEPIIAEKSGLIKRDMLFAISGRSRKPQIKLAETFGITSYPSPAGGCLLTDPIFAKKLKNAFRYGEDTINDIILLQYGRHFRFPSGAKIIVGRNQAENKTISTFLRRNDICLEALGVPSPLVILRNSKGEDDVQISASICLKYSDWKEETGKVSYWSGEEDKKFVVVKKIPSGDLQKMRC